MSYSCDKTPLPGSKPEFVADLNHQTLADAFVLCLCCWRPNTKSLLETTDAQKIVLRRWFWIAFWQAVSSKKCVTNVIICGWEPHSPFLGGGSGKLIKKARRNWFIFHKPCLTTGGYTCTSWALLTIWDAYMRSSTPFVVHFDQGHRHPLKYGGFLKWGYPNH